MYGQEADGQLIQGVVISGSLHPVGDVVQQLHVAAYRPAVPGHDAQFVAAAQKLLCDRVPLVRVDVYPGVDPFDGLLVAQLVVDGAGASLYRGGAEL